MRFLAVAPLLAALACQLPPESAGPPPPPAGDGYVILDESADAWIVKVPKSAGPAAIQQAARDLGQGQQQAAPGQPVPLPPAADVERPAAVANRTAGIRGHIVRGGQGVARCRVRLTPMKRNLGMLFWEEHSLGNDPEEVTGDDGRFVFVSVNPGAYRIKWAVPGATHWIKRLKEDPDIIVDARQQCVLPPIDIGRTGGESR